MENTKSRDNGGVGEKICEPCDDCYNLVQDAANEHRASLDQLDGLLKHIAENPEPVGEDFNIQVKKLKVRLVNMRVDSKISAGSGRFFSEFKNIFWMSKYFYLRVYI